MVYHNNHMCCCIRKAIGRVPLMPHIFIYVTNRALKSCMYPVKNQKPNSRWRCALQ
ncbi:hypothetical protein HanIR_Chr04g0202151 [Helianthus annuus]|nr:hypothetical protein HanIR_Chr04g0202151 [Helianthus annuus]